MAQNANICCTKGYNLFHNVINLAKTCSASFTFCIIRLNQKMMLSLWKHLWQVFSFIFLVWLFSSCWNTRRSVICGYCYSGLDWFQIRLFFLGNNWSQTVSDWIWMRWFFSNSVTSLCECLVTLKRHGENLSFDKAPILALAKSAQEDSKPSILAV